MIGQLTGDPQVKKLSSGHALTTFGLATNYAWKNENQEWQSGVDYHNVVAWQKLAERIAANFKKGESVFIEGKLRTRSWTNGDGEKRSRTEVVAGNVLAMSRAAAKEAEVNDEDEAIEEAWEKAEKEGVLK